MFTMGLGKVIAAIFGIILIILLVIGIDVYLTYNSLSGLSDDEINELVSNPTFEVTGTNNDTVTISVDVDLPSAGFIPKGVIIKLIVDFNGDKQTAEETVNFGDSKTLSLSFTMTSANAQALSSTGITVISEAVVIPTIFNQALNFAEQTIDLGSQSVSA